MKKILLSMSLVAVLVAHGRTVQELCDGVSACTNFSDKVALCDSITADEFKALLDDVVQSATTNLTVAYRRFAAPINMRYRLIKSFPQFTAEYDKKLSDLGFGVDPCWSYNALPLCCEVFVNDPKNADIVAAKAYYIGLIRKNKSAHVYGFAFPEVINLAADLASKGIVKTYMFANFKSRILSMAPRPIKRRIREQGGSFVVGPDGNNPVQDAVDELSVALNAPKMSGLKDFVAKWFPNHEWVEPAWMQDSDFAKLKDEVFYGERNLDDKNRCLFESQLGTEAYNRFVQEYNGTIK